MLLSLDSGVSALDQFQQDLNVIGNNIANVNTVGFKSADVEFADALSQSLGSNASSSTQIGTGVTTSGIVNQFTQGSISNTGNQSDLDINGNGFFLVNDPSNGQPLIGAAPLDLRDPEVVRHSQKNRSVGHPAGALCGGYRSSDGGIHLPDHYCTAAHPLGAYQDYSCSTLPLPRTRKGRRDTIITVRTIPFLLKFLHCDHAILPPPILL